MVFSHSLETNCVVSYFRVVSSLAKSYAYSLASFAFVSGPTNASGELFSASSRYLTVEQC